MGPNKLMDCIYQYKAGKYMASHANSNKLAWYKLRPNKRVVNSCRIRYDTKRKKVMLVCNNNLTELKININYYSINVATIILYINIA